MPLTLSELETRLRADTHPQGLPENLVGIYSRIILEGLVTLQKYVDCLQQNNTQLYPFCSTYWDCGATVVTMPRGRTKRVYTTATSNHCDKIYYSQISYARMLCLTRNHGLEPEPYQEDLPVLEPPFKYPNSSTDHDCHGRAHYGFYAIQRGRMYVYPHLHSSETLVIEWDGLKRDWQDGDVVNEDPDFYRTIRLFVAKEMERDYDKVPTWRETAMEYLEALRDMIHECREETRVRESEPCDLHVCCEDGVCYARETASEASAEEFVFANIGDFGDPNNGSAMADVAGLVKSWDPAFIVTNGDNIYTADGYDAVVGAHYDTFITDDLTTNRFWPSLGNHDYTDASLAAYQAYFTLPNNERYYTVTRYGVQFFIYNTSKFNVAATSPEPDGVAAGSIQADWLRLMLATSTARWKVVIIHDTPFTDHVNDYPGHTELRLPFAAWGADAVISGDAHGYFHYTVDGIPYLVNGLGGAPITTLQATPNVHDAYRDIRYIENYGAIKGTVSCDELKFEFINILGEVIDTVILEHEDE